MADPQRPYPFFRSKNDTSSIPVNAWSQMLLSPETLPFSQSCKVWKAYHCKCTTNKDHEFVVVVFDYNGNIVSIFVDRVGDSDNPARSSTSLISMPATPNGSLHDVGASSARLPPAKDGVYVTQDGSEESIFARAEEVHGPYDVLSTLETSANTNAMNAAHIAILVRAVSHLKPLYDANATQCYWFAHSVFQVIKSVTKCEEKLGVNSDMRGKYYMLSVVKPAKSKDTQQGVAVRSCSKGQGDTEGRADSWKKYARLTPGQGPDVEAVLRDYDLALAKEEKTWEQAAAAAEQARRNELDAKQVDEERKKAAAAEKIAVDERAAAAAAKHNEEIAKQTAAAAKQTAEEERAAAAAARKNEEIAKKQAEEAVKYAAELEEVVRALKAQVGVQGGI